MNDFLKKLNVLIRSNVSEALSPTGTTTSGDRQRSPAPLGQDIDRELDRLRQRIDDALAYEDVLRGRLAELDGEIAQWDGQADRAVEASDDAGGRYAITQMRRVEARRAQLERDLRQHQAAAQEFIAQVEQLEGYVAQQRTRAEQTQSAQTPRSALPTAIDEQTNPGMVTTLADRVRNVVESVQQAVEQSRVEQSREQARPSTTGQAPSLRSLELDEEQDAPTPQASERELDSDLDRRRQRLQRPPSPNSPPSSSGSASQ